MRALLVSDLHYELPKFDWLLSGVDDLDVLVMAGDLLDIASSVPLDVQIGVVLEYLTRLAAMVPTVVCSGNHDLDTRKDMGEKTGEKTTEWILEARKAGVVVDGDSVTIREWTITSCAWWEGPETLQRLERALDDAASERGRFWMWAYHGPPDGPLSWTGSRNYGDPELPRLLERHSPDVVLCGHVHEAPYVPDGAWVEQRGNTWLFNGGRVRGAVPAHVVLDLDGRVASWWSTEGAVETSFGAPVRAPVREESAQ